MGRKIAAIALSLGCLHTGSVMALGLGELELESFLNEPLKAQVDLLNIGSLHADEIKVRLATREDFEKMGLERAYFLTGIKFEVVSDEAGNPSIMISSDDPVLEPYLDFIVEARWPTGRLLREYTVLVDPPVFNQADPVVSASQRVEEVEGIPAPGKKTEEPAVTESSGTQVKMRKSDLAPGEMPDRKFSADTASSPMAGARYMIHRDDTLWEIARAARPANTSVHQTMLDIQRLNPDAFIDGNINRIKAGYIIYLPSEGDISSDDLASALAEVKQQNEDWRAGRASAPIASTGPTLRISADEPGTASDDSGGSLGTDARDTAASGMAADEQADLAALESQDQGDRLEAMEQQVETLNRIVSLKDEQIAALQAALAEAQSGVAAEPGELDSPMGVGEPASDTMSMDEGSMPDDDAAGSMAAVEAEDVEDIDAGIAVTEVPDEPEPTEEAEETQPAAVPAAPKKQVQSSAPPAEQGGIMGYLWYILGAVLVAVLGFVFLRRRGDTEEAATQTAAAPAPAEDVFADVKLKEQPLQVEAPAEEPAPAEPEAEEEPDSRDSRGYGERKHDEYASDVDAGDALAEADIYIAYGRYPQAIDLLSNAVNNDPGNAAYRLKLLELYAETDNDEAARAQLEELKAIGDTDSVARGESVLADMAKADEDDASRFIQADEPAGTAPETPPAGLAEAADEPLQSDFTGLEIEDQPSEESAPEDLDLSADFSGNELAQGDDEELVIAADSNGLSTKLDLARAYLDMGDEDGARQILEEVVAEGGDELKAEAGALLERIG